MKKSYSTVVLSDIHLGSVHSKAREVTDFLSGIKCETLILNGDIIDGWQLRKARGKWRKEHTDFFRAVMRMMESGTQIIYVRGNHDDFLDVLAPLKLGGISIVKDYLLRSHGKSYYVTHGDIFDSVTTNMRWLAKAGDIGYTFLLWLNNVYNRLRERQGKPYYSLSQKVKEKVKSAVSYISDFERELVALARSKQVDGVICGHIHQPANCFYDNIHYLNSGDWVESMTALLEDDRGNWSVLNWSEQPVPVDNRELETLPGLVGAAS